MEKIEGGREGGGGETREVGWSRAEGLGGDEPICVYGFGGKEINDLTFLFGFNEVGIEGLCPLGSTLHPDSLPVLSSQTRLFVT